MTEINVFTAPVLSGAHSLIGGTTGSGKSVLLHHITGDLLRAGHLLIIIDLKKVEFYKLRKSKAVLYYADTPEKTTTALRLAEKIMAWRFRRMRWRGLTNYPDAGVYVIIDEYADVILTCKKQAEPIINRIAILGRAAGVHLIIATQRPTREIIGGAIRANLSPVIALRCATAQESRNLMGIAGAEALPLYGYCYIQDATGTKLYKIPPPEK